jgi:hypothetical protein
MRRSAETVLVSEALERHSAKVERRLGSRTRRTRRLSVFDQVIAWTGLQFQPIYDEQRRQRGRKERDPDLVEPVGSLRLTRSIPISDLSPNLQRIRMGLWIQVGFLRAVFNQLRKD